MALGGWAGRRDDARARHDGIHASAARTPRPRGRLRRAVVTLSAAVVGLGVVGAAGTLAIPGVASAAGNIHFTTAQYTFFSTSVGTVETATLFVDNTSSTSVLFPTTPTSSASLTLQTGTPAGQFSVTQNTCSGFLGSFTTCFIVLTFSPTIPGHDKALLTVAATTGAQASMEVTGTGLAAFSLTSSTVTFGTVGVGDTSPAQTVILHATAPRLTVTSVSVTPTSTFELVPGNSCAGNTLTVSTFTSCKVSVTFTPPTLGPFSGFLDLIITGHTVAVSLSGTGIANTIAVLSPTPVTFGTVPVGSAGAMTATLVNIGSNPLVVSGVSITGVDATDFVVENPASPCGAQVPSGTTCKIAVAFTPSTVATGLTAQLHVTANIAAPGTVRTVTLVGNGQTPSAGVTVTPATQGWGSVKQGVGVTKPFTVHNGSTQTVHLGTISTFSADYTVTGGTCDTANLAATGTCTFSVTFDPSIAGPDDTTLQVPVATGSPVTAALSGTGVAIAKATVTPTSVTFPSTPVGLESAPRRVTLTNTGQATVTTISMSLLTPNAADFTLVSTRCTTPPVTLTPGQSCSALVVFAPKTVSGSINSILQVADSAGTFTVALSGSSTASSTTLSISPAPAAFGAVGLGQSKLLTVTVSDIGANPVTFKTASLTPPATSPFSIASQSCDGATLDPAGLGDSTCTVVLDFSPTALGDAAAVLLLPQTVNGTAVTAMSRIQVTGTGVAATTATLTPTHADFGTVPSGQASAPQRFTVTNTGATPLYIDPDAVMITGTSPAASAAFQIMADGCTQTTMVTLAPGQHCTIYVVFAPGAVVSTLSAELEVTTNLTGGTSSPAVLMAALTGNGTTPAVTVTATPADLAFGSVGLTVPSRLTVTITNNGTNPATLGTVAVSTTFGIGLFMASGNCTTGLSLSPGTSCTEQVTFAPLTLGVTLGTLTVPVTGGPPLMVPLSGTGVPSTDVSITPAGTPGQLTFPATQSTSASSEQFVVVTNTGSNPLFVTTVGVTLTAATNFTVGTDTCLTFPIAPGYSCVIGLRFTPTAVQGWVTGTLLIFDNGSSSEQVVHLRGDATANGVPYTVSPASLSLTFGTVGVGTTSTKTLTVTNTSASTLALATPPVTLTDTVNYQLGVDTCATVTLDPHGTIGDHCTVQVTFMPATNGPHPASAVVHPATGIATVVTLSGTGVPQVAKVSVTMTPPASGTLTFPPTPVGTSSAPENEVITVTGTTPFLVTAVTIGGTTAAATQFSIVGTTCKDNPTLLATATCQISVVFSPTSNGVKAAELLITDNAPGGTQVVNLVGTGGTAFTGSTGYDMVGSDGGVFVFNPTGVSGGFYGSLPGIHVKPVAPIVGIVSTTTNQGYFLVGADGGVFAFGPTAPFHGSLPGIHVKPAAPIVGIVAANTDQGYFLVGADGGVFAFGTVTFLGSLPGSGINVDNIIGIASTPSGDGYWVISATGTVYGFGNAGQFGTVSGSASPVSSIAGTPTGGGYWISTQNGTVFALGNAISHGTLPGLNVTPVLPVVSIVRTATTGGYWLIGADGGIFAFGNASFYGSLPGLNIQVDNIVGAVPN